MSALLSELLERGALTSIDLALARHLCGLAGEENQDVALAVALCSRAVRTGHVCLDLRQAAHTTLRDDKEQPLDDLVMPEATSWVEAVSSSPLTGGVGEAFPLVVDEDGRLYLQRYASYEQRLAKAIAARSEPLRIEMEESSVRALFDGVTGRGQSAQYDAVVDALSRRFFVIAGGPGTGKTTVVVKLLAALQHRALSDGTRPLSIRLLAPTGKAAQRLGEAVAAGMDRLVVPDEVKQSIPQKASTVHRALGYQPRTPTRFRHGRDNPLADDVVIVDEASMVDIALMTKLFEAVRPAARLVLLGDKDQLASVEAGAVLGDLYQAGTLDPRLGACFGLLTKSYRFDSERGIGRLAQAINAGDVEAAVGALSSDEVRLTTPSGPPSADRSLLKGMMDAFLPCFRSALPEERLATLGTFRVLAAHRRGPFGVETLNRLIIESLEQKGRIEAGAEHFDGRPILIVENEPRLELFNGDLGMVCRENGQLWAFFPSPDGSAPRRLSLSLLPRHETAFAMTIHKSQGSEFDRVCIVLPSNASALLSRELLYTAVSRARRQVDIHGTEAIVKLAIGRRVMRHSGLLSRLASALSERES